LFRLLPSVRNHLLAVWAELDLTPAQARLVERLDADHPLPMTELANALCCDASNVTGLVDRLETRGLIERAASPDDRRVKMIALTKAGAVLQAALRKRVSELPPFMTSLSPSEQETLRDILRKAQGTEPGDHEER
jgi:DNA-binding MarR family transcriptional regulator